MLLPLPPFIVIFHKLILSLSENPRVLKFGVFSAQGVIRLTVIEARDLKAADTEIIGRGLSDPYCIIKGLAIPGVLPVTKLLAV